MRIFVNTNVSHNTMQTEITSNKWTFYGRFVLIIPLVWLFYKPIENAMSRPSGESHIFLLIFFICFVIVLVLFLVIGLFFRPISVGIDTINNLIFIKYLGAKTRQIQPTDIKGYSTTLLWSQGKNYEGLLLYLSDNSKIELTDFNIKTYVPVQEYLVTSQVTYYGHEQSWFPFRPFRYKYQNK